jgi:hypothetical protein
LFEVTRLGEPGFDGSDVLIHTAKAFSDLRLLCGRRNPQENLPDISFTYTGYLRSDSVKAKLRSHLWRLKAVALV